MISGFFDSNQSYVTNWNSGVVGLLFAVGNSSLEVTRLGFWDYQGDGFATSHQIGIWDQSGTLLGSATLSSGTSNPMVGDWRYVDLGSSITLSANTNYYAAASTTANDADSWVGSWNLNPGYSFSSDFNVNIPGGNPQLYISTSGVFGPPDTGGGTSNVGYALNFEYNAVPEPTVIWLTGCGLLFVSLYRNRRLCRVHSLNL